MPRANEVKPVKWSGIKVLYDNGEFSVISGLYSEDNKKIRSLGTRWNGDENSPYGFPSFGGHPIWHVIPAALVRCIIMELIELGNKKPYKDWPDHLNNIHEELTLLS